MSDRMGLRLEGMVVAGLLLGFVGAHPAHPHPTRRQMAIFHITHRCAEAAVCI